MEKHGDRNLAGDAKDQFHLQVMSAGEMTKAIKGWRMAWKGKVCTAVDFAMQNNKDDIIMLIAIEGGPECLWEIEQLTNNIMSSFVAKGANLRLKMIKQKKLG